MRDWTDSKAYEFTSALTPEQWAWEFLRRNPEYRSQWQAFWETRQSLEAIYGRPPDRDFNAWKQDLRAWVPASECGAGECRMDQDKVLIECAFGARWGFYKFPPDPDQDDAVGRGLLTWREPDREGPEPLGLEDRGYLGDDLAKVALGFDLRLPLRAQLEQAKRLLQVLQRQRRQQGMQLMTVVNFVAQWRLYLRLLDAEGQGANRSEMARRFGLSALEDNLSAARAMADGGYRSLLLLER